LFAEVTGERVSLKDLILPLAICFLPLPALAQSISPAPDGTGTVVTPQGNTLNITGGTPSKDGANLFHSFIRFGLTPEEIANFQSSPEIRNILGRITGGDASLIDGLIRVTGGNSNLFLINPAGIIFGPNARLDVPASFMATSANGIGFGSGWFNASGSNDFAALVGTPNAFAFTLQQPGAVLNFGRLAVESGQSLTLLGGTAISTGSLSAPAGAVTVAAVPGESVVRLSQAGMLLSLDIQPLAGSVNLPDNWRVPAVSLPQMLTGGGVSHATDLTVNSDGTVRLAGSGLRVPAGAGTAIVSGAVDVSGTAPGQIGGAVNVLGEKVGLAGARINASGNAGGGTVLIGGGYRGLGSVPNALRTFVSGDSAIIADSLVSGNGGRVTVWADGVTGFYGSISARGGTDWGNGGFVEVSGKESLIFRGAADLSAARGSVGTLLLDPENITIVDGAGGADDLQVTDSEILEGDAGGTFTISEQALEGLTADADIILEATNGITINDLTDNQLSLQATTGSVTFTADADGNGAGAFSMDAGDTIYTQGGAVAISGASLRLGRISTNTGNLSLKGNEIDFLGGANSVTGTGALTLMPATPEQNIALAGATVFVYGGAVDADLNTLDLTADDLAALGDNFSSITIGRTDGSGAVTVAGDVTFNNSVTVQAPVGAGSITSAGTTITVAEGNSIQLIANQNLDLGDIAAPGGNIALTSNTGSIAAGNLNSSSANSSGGAIDMTAAGDITAAGDLNSSSSAGSGSGGPVTLNAGGNITAGAINATGTLGGGDISLRGSEIDLTGGASTVTSTGTIRLEPATPEGNISIGGAAAGEGDDPNTVDLTADDIAALADGFNSITIGRPYSAGAITVTGDITFNDPLTIQAPVGAGSITSAGTTITLAEGTPVALTANENITAGNITAPGGNISLTSTAGNIDTSAGLLDASSNAGNGGEIFLQAGGNITAGDANAVAGGYGAGGAIIFSSGSGSINTGNLNTSSANGTGGAVELTAPGGISPGNINSSSNSGSSGGNIQLNGPAVLSRDVSLDTGTGAGDITLSSTVDGAQNLTLAAGTGNITFNGAVGSVTRLGDLTVNSGNNVLTQAISAASLTQNAGTGTTTFNGALDTTAIGGINLTGNNFALNAPVTTTNGGGLSVNNSGQVTIAPAADLNLAGGFSQTGVGGVVAGGEIAGSSIQFNSAVTLTDNTSLNTSAGNGDISFNSTVDGTVNLTLNAGTGNITLSGDAGSTDRLGNLTFSSANNVLTQAINAASLTQNAGTGTTTFNGALQTTAIGGISLTGNNFALNAPVTTTNGGGLSVNNSGQVTIAPAADLNLAGGFSQTGVGGVVAGGEIAGSSILFNSAVTLTDSISLNTLGNGDIAFNNTVDGGGNLTLNAGSGNISFMGAVGSSFRLGNLTVESAGDVQAGSIRAAGMTQTAGTGTTAISGALDTDGAAGINLTGATFTLSGPVSAAGAVNIEATNNITASNIAASGGIALSSSAGNIDTRTGTLDSSSATGAGGNISVTSETGAVTLGDVRSSGVSAGGDIAISAADSITAGRIDSSASAGDGGDVRLYPQGDIQVASINAQGGAGGAG
jgi:filamentous hemagglutinin family protein